MSGLNHSDQPVGIALCASRYEGAECNTHGWCEPAVDDALFFKDLSGGNVARSYIDHIAITAPTLAVGMEFVQRSLGVMPQVGGEHPRMGTHNPFARRAGTTS